MSDITDIPIIDVDAHMSEPADLWTSRLRSAYRDVASESKTMSSCSVIELTRAFGIEAVAEGVETREQLAALRRLGCVFGQGFLWSRSLSPADLETYVMTSRPVAPHPDSAPHAIRRAATT